ncbi:MAG: pitrilysin family protein [Acidobacteriota bacterium]
MNTGVRRDPPVPGPGQPVAFPPVTRLTLANGLAVWFVERRQLPFVSVSILVPAGSSADPVEQPGVASLLADMLDEGAGGRSAIEVQEAFGRLGTSIDTDAGFDGVLLSFAVLPRHAAEACALAADLLIRPRLGADDLDRVRTLRLNRLRQLPNSAGALADQAFGRAVFGDHPYGHQPWGLVRAIEQMRVEDLARLHGSTYRPSSCTMIVAGSLDQADVAHVAESAFGAWAAPMAPDFRGDTIAAAVPALAAPRLILVDRPGAAQTELRIGHLAVSRRTPDYHAMVLLNAIVGGQFVSRINMNLREQKGYTYGAHTAFDLRRMAGSFVLQTSVQTDATADAVRESIAELTAIRRDRPPTAHEIEFGYATLTRGYARNFETTGQLARALGQLALYDLPDHTFDRFVPDILAVRADQLAQAAERHLRPEDLVVVAVGDRAKVESGLARIGLGDPVVTTVEV